MPPRTAEDEFLLALTTVRATYGPTSINETDLKEIVATEESRVADATVIAELISSRIAAQGSRSPFASDLYPQPEEKPTKGLPTPIPFPTSNTASPLNIADLLDGMLAQEKRDVRKPTQS
jgi:hypothetical protein